MCCVRDGSWCGGAQFMWNQVVHYTLGWVLPLSVLPFLPSLSWLGPATTAALAAQCLAVSVRPSMCGIKWYTSCGWASLGPDLPAMPLLGVVTTTAAASQFILVYVESSGTLLWPGPCLSLSFLHCLALVVQQQQQWRSGFQSMWNQVVHFSVFPRS
jgi:hypothetical protein